MQARYDEFQQLDAAVMAVTFVELPRLTAYLAEHDWRFDVVTDPRRHAYRAFGLDDAGWWRLLRPRVLWAYLSLVFRGRRPRWAYEDVHQLGGDFVVDARGGLAYAYRSRDPADRPSVTELLEAVRAAHRAANGLKDSPGLAAR